METADRKEHVNSFGDRRSASITALETERRELRKSLKRAEIEMEKNGFGSLLKIRNKELSKLKRAEACRRKQADKRRTLNVFKKNPFGTTKNIFVLPQLVS